MHDGCLHIEFIAHKVMEWSCDFSSHLNPSVDVCRGLISLQSRPSEVHYSLVWLRICCSWCFSKNKILLRPFNVHLLVANWFNWKRANLFPCVYTLLYKLIRNPLVLNIHSSTFFHGWCFQSVWTRAIFNKYCFKVKSTAAFDSQFIETYLGI